MDIATRLFEAHAAAQAAFHRMLVDGVFSDPDDERTKAYVAAERLVDSILVDAQWDKAKDALDALQAADNDFAGDHHVYPAGVGR